ncbi:MAG: HAD-IIIC family phosphatase [Acidimicrobiia bacterium]
MTTQRSGAAEPAAEPTAEPTAEPEGPEVPTAATCARLARAHERAGEAAGAWRAAVAAVDGGDDFTSWSAAAAVLRRCAAAAPPPRRSIRLAVLGSSTTAQLTDLLPLVLGRLGVAVELYEADYAQYRQEVLDPDSGLYRFAPDTVLLAVHDGALGLPLLADDPDAEVEAEVARWTALWAMLQERLSCRVVQHLFAIDELAPFGHLAAKLPGSRETMARRVNLRLGEEAAGRVAVVDCDRVASLLGKERWFDPRFWVRSKQAVSLEALPALARHTAAVVGAELGLSRKCLVLDLDNTLWGGVIGEDGLAGIKLGGSGDGEAFVGFQEHLLDLRRRGVILAVVSKNNPDDAREPFERHPEMRLALDDFAAFVASWEPKADQIRAIAATLSLGLDAFVFVDDNPVERDAIRQLLPEVDVVALPDDPALYARALSQYLHFETTSFTAEDAERTAQYRARALAAAESASASTLEEFVASLEQVATIRPFDEVDLDRIHQLVGKTNQFNLTTVRHTRDELRSFMDDPDCIHFTLRLRDRFADHGLVSLLVARPAEGGLEIVTWLMSCRVIGRTVEATMLHHLSGLAAAAGHTALRGVHVPTAKNDMVREVYGDHGFVRLEELPGGGTVWGYDLASSGPVPSGPITVRT